jgi:hypothetical protein
MCSLMNNVFSGFSLLEFTGVSTASMDLDNTFCIPASFNLTCSAGMYFDKLLNKCVGMISDYSFSL